MCQESTRVHQQQLPSSVSPAVMESISRCSGGQASCSAAPMPDFQPGAASILPSLFQIKRGVSFSCWFGALSPPAAVGVMEPAMLGSVS